LKKKDSLYRKLWDLQAGGFLRDEDADDEPVVDDIKESENKEDGKKIDAKMVNF